jgi:hypothetical protein
MLLSFCDPLAQVTFGCEVLCAAQKAGFGSRYFGRVPLQTPEVFEPRRYRDYSSVN